MLLKLAHCVPSLILIAIGAIVMLTNGYLYITRGNKVTSFLIEKKIPKFQVTENEKILPGKEKRLPGFIISGFQKCGTQALATFLSYHPKLTRAGKTEVHFFDRIAKLDKSVSYMDLMPDIYPWEMSYEKTPAYADRVNVSTIYKTVPGVKIILQICDPVDRTMSAFLHCQQNALKGFIVSKNETFESVILDVNGQVNETSPLIRRGVYIDYIQNYLKYFPRDRILITDMMKLKINPAETLHRVETFLNITHFFKEKQFYFNIMLNTSCIHTDISNATPIKKSKVECLGTLGRNKHRLHPAMKPKTRKKLQKYFAPFNEKLKKVIIELN
ncbi:unnamed protein product [Owenia fusiformis]|uniref:Uncharacterized protein n=1 Tax=Owenia fusiformis TaxID=6347 RepID=A0A8J1Y516_OWEFU|nr:unnamed protein product [Owenia fusiformis]